MATIYESDDTTGIRNLYPLRDVDALTDEQASAVATATQEAMRPLVEAEWTKRGHEVAGWREPQLFGRLADDDDLNQDLKSEQVEVWGAAYGQLDEDAVWASVTPDRTYVTVASCTYRDEVRRYDITTTSEGAAVTQAQERYGKEVGVDYTDVIIKVDGVTS